MYLPIVATIVLYFLFVAANDDPAKEKEVGPAGGQTTTDGQTARPAQPNSESTERLMKEGVDWFTAKYGMADSKKCNSPEAQKIISENLVKEKVTGLLSGKTYTDVMRREVVTSFIVCVLTKYTMKDNILKADVISVRMDQTNKVDETWTEQSQNGVFTVDGVWYNEPAKNPSFTDEYKFFYADENVIGTYYCRTKGFQCEKNYWMVAISVVKDKQNTEEAKESLRKAKEQLAKIRLLTGDMADVKQEKCPNSI